MQFAVQEACLTSQVPGLERGCQALSGTPQNLHTIPPYAVLLAVAITVAPAASSHNPAPTHRELKKRSMISGREANDAAMAAPPGR